MKTDRPFLIIGCGSSGSHLLSILLDSHPELACGPELGLLNKPALYRDDYDRVSARLHRWIRFGKTTEGWQNYRKFMVDVDKYFWTQGEVLHAASSVNSLREFLDLFFCRFLERRGARIWGEQTLSNGYCVDDFLNVYPNARLVHLVRDGRDVMSSLIRRGQSPYRSAARWLYDVTACRAHSKLESYLEIRYEDLVRATEDSLMRICEHIGVRYDSQMLTNYSKNRYWIEVTRGKRVHSSWNQSPFGGAITPRSIGRHLQSLNSREVSLFWSMALTPYARKKLQSTHSTNIELMDILGYPADPPVSVQPHAFDLLNGAFAWSTRAIREVLTEGNTWPPLTRARRVLTKATDTSSVVQARE